MVDLDSERYLSHARTCEISTGHKYLEDSRNVMAAVRLMAIASIVIILLTVVGVSRAQVSPTTYPLGTMTWTLVSAPKIAPMGSAGLEESYKNNLNATVEGFVYADVHNSIGQTLLITVSTLNIPAGSIGATFSAVWFGVGQGNYTASVFATSVSGVALSNSTSVSYYI
jgi:hypothetical protein